MGWMEYVILRLQTNRRHDITCLCSIRKFQGYIFDINLNYMLFHRKMNYVLLKVRKLEETKLETNKLLIKAF